MPVYAIVFGAALSALGLVAYFDPAPLGVGKDGQPATPGHPSAMAPLGTGGLLVAAGLVSLAAPGARKHAMHAAAMVALLGVLGGVIPAALRGFAVEQVAVKVGLGMTGLSAVFLVLCVRSFIAARKAREARGGGTGA
ncbi:MAG TPA: hypothetical protein VH092_05915 [Urbifossiella sp.]|jgi:hypothetical protein|nr:hypothetical protein [Urbifossiella sp.]